MTKLYRYFCEPYSVWVLYEIVMNDFLGVSCPSEIKVKVKIECWRWVIYRYSVIASTQTFFSLFFFWIQPQMPSSLSPSSLPLTTWAVALCYCHMSEQQPSHHSRLWLARPFQVGEPLPDNNLVWLLEQRCNWLIHFPCLGPGFWSSLYMCLCMCACLQGW